jgi:AraC family transcriptional regulator
MTQLIEPNQIPRFVPGQLTVSSPADGWHGVSVRGYRYTGSDVEVPPIRDYTVVAYARGSTPMRRRVEGRWTSEDLGPGDVSLLTRATDSHWIWPGDVEVVHVYLTQAELASTCRQMYDREVQDVALHDVVKADDPLIHHTAMLLAAEAAGGGAGSQLMVEALCSQLAVLILRRHADVRLQDTEGDGRLTFRQERAVRDYIAEHLGEAIVLRDLAAAAGLSRYHFARRFHRSVGTPPHEFVLQQRVERAKTLLTRSDQTLPAIACGCGFADQSHLTREFKKRVGTPPGRYRATTR